MATVVTKNNNQVANIAKLRANANRVQRELMAEFPVEINLSPRDSKQFLQHLKTPPKPNQKLKKAVARFKQSAGGKA